MVPRKHAQEHYLNTHAPVACSLCSDTIDRDILEVHTGENCPQRIVTCEYSSFLCLQLICLNIRKYVGIGQSTVISAADILGYVIEMSMKLHVILTQITQLQAPPGNQGVLQKTNQDL